MKHLAGLWLLALPLFCPLHAETEGAEGALWKIEDEDSTVFLGGTIHLLRDRDWPIPDGYDRAYEEAEEIVFEVDLGELANPKTIREMEAQGALPEDETLSDHFSPETMAALDDFLLANDMPEAFFDRMRPGKVMLTVAIIQAMNHGARPERGLELRYYRKSANDGKPVRGLETHIEQLGFFERFDAGLIESEIVESLEEADDFEVEFDKLVAAWRSGDANRISEVIVDRMAETPEMRKVLLTERNERWVPEIIAALEGGDDVLFLVGAAHLPGEGGVLEGLREKGFEVSRLEPLPDDNPKE